MKKVIIEPKIEQPDVIKYEDYQEFLTSSNNLWVCKDKITHSIYIPVEYDMTTNHLLIKNIETTGRIFGKTETILNDMDIYIYKTIQELVEILNEISK